MKAATLCLRLTALLVGHLTAAAGSAEAPSAVSPWPVAGRQGLIQVVIVPAAQARDRDAYLAQVGLLCAPQATCFVNFFTNSTGAPLAVPLPSAIDQEATAIFRRSVKQGGEFFRWSCRLRMDGGDCF